MTRPPMLAADHIRELVQGHTTNEDVTQPVRDKTGTWRPETRKHTVRHASLLDQLEEAVTQSPLTAEDLYHAAPRSKPSARLDALDVIQRIDRQSKQLATELGLPRTPLRPRLMRISGELGHEPNAQVRRWWSWARLATAWDSPPYAPQVPCSECDRRGTLRIRIADRIASCVECHSFWGDAEFDRFALYVAWAAEHLSGPRHWLTDDDGYPVECVECLATRQGIAERAALRRAEAS